jgi:hypothetical protein
MPQFTNMVQFEINGNNFTGTIGSALANMPGLAKLDLQFNKFKGIVAMVVDIY